MSGIMKGARLRVPRPTLAGPWGERRGVRRAARRQARRCRCSQWCGPPRAVRSDKPLMSRMTFQLPDHLGQDALRDLECACMAGGPDNMPWPTAHQRQGQRLTLVSQVEESGYVVVPWSVDG